MSAPIRAAVLAVGDELLWGAHPDLDTHQVAGALVELGLAVDRGALEPDDVDAIAGRLSDLIPGRRLVVTTGGLGPTDDDVTRDAIAKVAGVPLEFNGDAFRAMEQRYLLRHRTVPLSNRRQALIPQGAEVLPNARGTAPGFWLELPSKTVIAALPGPPGECAGMLHDELVPRVRARIAGVSELHRLEFSLIGLPESQFADLLGDWMARTSLPRMGVSARDGVLAVKLTDHGPLGRERLDARAAAFRERFRRWIYAGSHCGLEDVVVAEARARGRTLTFAESCTGGLVSERLTRVPGASAVLGEAYVVYSEAAKQRILGVPPELLFAEGVVSEAVARAMARGARERSGADLAVALTGVAGPDGGSDRAPVGRVCFALEGPAGSRSFSAQFPGTGRQRIRVQAAQFALDLLRRELLALEFADLPWLVGRESGQGSDR